MPSQDASTAQPASAADAGERRPPEPGPPRAHHFDAPVTPPTIPPTVFSTSPSG